MQSSRVPVHNLAEETVQEIRTTQVHLRPGLIDFGIGQPGFDLLPLSIMQQAAVHRLSKADPYLLNYGYEQGDGYCRLGLAEFLEPWYGGAVDPDALILTAGASQALSLICTLYASPGDVVLVEEPSYFLALRIFADHRLRVVGLPTDQGGLVVDAVEEALVRHRPAFLYTIPTYQNPTGTNMSQARRRQLVSLAREHELLVVADEVYHLLHYDGMPPTPLALSADRAPILSLGSFSKILAPGLRLGWIHATPQRILPLAKCGLVDSGGGLNHFTSGLVRSVLELDLLQTYVAQLRATYGRRVEAMDGALRRVVPSADYVKPGGGFFFWLTLPPQMDSETLLTEAHRGLVGFQPGVRFSSRQALRNCLRLSFAFFGEADIERGIQRLGEVVEHAMDSR